MKKLLALMLALGMTVSLAACGGGADTADTADNASETETAEAADAAETEETADAAEASGDKYVVGICQLVQHEALDQATQGFKDALMSRTLPMIPRPARRSLISLYPIM